MPANRKDTLKIDGAVHEIIYAHDTNALVLKGASTRFVLEEVGGQYVLETQQRRDLVANELLTREEKGENLTAQDLVSYGFREK